MLYASDASISDIWMEGTDLLVAVSSDDDLLDLAERVDLVERILLVIDLTLLAAPPLLILEDFVELVSDCVVLPDDLIE